jgi:hypothetical protein
MADIAAITMRLSKGIKAKLGCLALPTLEDAHNHISDQGSGIDRGIHAFLNRFSVSRKSSDLDTSLRI